MLAHGRATRGQRQPGAKLTEADVREIRRLAGTMLQREIGKMFGVSRVTVTSVLSGKRWGWLG